MNEVLNGKYKVLNQLKSGGFSSVYLAEDINLEMKVVLKKFHLEKMVGKLKGTSRALKYNVENEIKRAIHFNHPNIARYFDFFTFQDKDAFGTNTYEVGVMEYISGGTIKEYIEQKGIDSTESKNALKAVLTGIQYLHDQQIIHRDIKSDNILMQGDTVKIIDFGISKKIEQAQTLLYGEGESQSELITTLEYSAPEQLDPHTFGVNETISYGIDIWMFGVLVYYLNTGRFPFGTNSGLESSTKLRMNVLSLPNEKIDWSGVSNFYQKIIEPCLVKHASKRATADQIMELFETSNKVEHETQTVLIDQKITTSGKTKFPKKIFINAVLFVLFIFVSFLVIKYFTKPKAELSHSTLIPYQSEGKFGFKDESGQIIIPAKYEQVSAFENGRVTVHHKDSVLEIDREGHTLKVISVPATPEPQITIPKEAIDSELRDFIAAFNTSFNEEKRIQLVQNAKGNFKKWSQGNSIFAINNLNEASLEAVFYKAIERNKEITLEAIELEKNENKIKYALFSLPK